MRTGLLVCAAIAAAAAVQAQSGPNDARAREIYKLLVEINTTDTPAGSVTNAAEAVAARLKAAGFAAADVQLLGPDPRKHNLIARLRGSGARRPILLLAHLDVVEARRDDWSFDPFTFLEKDGFFYGRGTIDDKALASIFTANLIRLKQDGVTLDRDVILALTADEEGGSFNGASWLVDKHRDLIDAEFAINEGGGGQSRNGKPLVNEIQASEKVYQDFRLEAKNPGGHSSRPIRDNAIYHLSDGLARLAAFDFPLDMNEVTRGYFAKMAALQTSAQTAADMRAMAAPTPDPQAAARLAAASPYYNALMRTTCVATMLSGGHAPNALPQTATANVNCRILPGQAPAAIKAKLESVIADPKIAIAFVEEAKPSAPSPLRPDVMSAVESLTRAMWPGAIVVPMMGTGATDSLYLRNAGIPAYGVDGVFSEIDDNRAHGRDERVAVKSYFDALEFQYRLLRVLAGHP
jgi:acetylornithine deacetylase/succinyl-diaminopimelate desuccinylase-like protein